MSLLSFCTDANSTVARERLLYVKAVYELKLFAAKCGVEVQVTEPEIDNLGHDFVLSVGRDALNIQNKAVLRPRGVSEWKIHASHLMPAIQDRDIAPDLDGLPMVWPSGASGVVLLHEVNREAATRGELKVSYRYFDVYYAAAVAHGFFAATNFSAAEALQLLRRINAADASERVVIPRRAFLPISSPAAILELRFHEPRCSNFVSVWSRAHERVPGPWAARPAISEMVRKELEALWTDPVRSSTAYAATLVGAKNRV